mgnify:CR=1 FL=1
MCRQIWYLSSYFETAFEYEQFFIVESIIVVVACWFGIIVGGNDPYLNSQIHFFVSAKSSNRRCACNASKDIFWTENAYV